jgi:hypothetical protein
MKSRIKALLEMLKELIPETNQESQGYNKMRLIPVPVKPREQKRPNPFNTIR